MPENFRNTCRTHLGRHPHPVKILSGQGQKLCVTFRVDDLNISKAAWPEVKRHECFKVIKDGELIIEGDHEQLEGCVILLKEKRQVADAKSSRGDRRRVPKSAVR